MLVEPSTTQARIIGEHLSSAGVANLEVCGDGATALLSMQRYQPDLVISSMYLPDMTG